jgi:hypothetical protein
MYVRGGEALAHPLYLRHSSLNLIFTSFHYIRKKWEKEEKKIYIKNIVELFRMYVFNYKKDARNVMYSSFYRTLPKSS